MKTFKLLRTKCFLKNTGNDVSPVVCFPLNKECCEKFCPLIHLFKNDKKNYDKLTAHATELLETLKLAWYFIENVEEDDPERTSKFFELREKVRNVFSKVLDD